MILSEIIRELESLAPPALQEGYDNSGLIVGNRSMEVSGVLICLDSIEATIDEAIHKNCNLVVAHHPIVFSGLKSLTGKTYIERTVLKAIKNDISIYAIHTNLDNVKTGVNAKIGQLLGINSPKILAPKTNILQKLVTYCPQKNSDEVRNALFEAEAGSIGNYAECSFNSNGTGTFKANEAASQHIGNTNERHLEAETKIEVVFEAYKKNNLLATLNHTHPYEEVAYEIYDTLNSHQYIGAGMYGDLESEMEVPEFFDGLKSRFNLKVIRHTKILKNKITRIAWSGGSGSFLLRNAQAVRADVFITGDFKYHEFFDHEEKLVIADIGHYESEQFTIELIGDFLKEKFPKFAVHLTEVNTNPVNYY